jgi:hypothetical protein
MPTAHHFYGLVTPGGTGPNVKSNSHKYCLVIPGNEFVVYIRWGGGVKVNLRPSNKGDVFKYFCFNPETGKSHAAKTVEVGEIRYFASPESYPAVNEFNDWVLRIRKKQP